MAKPNKAIFQEASKSIWDVNAHDNPIIRTPELPIVRDETGKEFMITKDPELDAQVKKGIELMVRSYSVKGKLQDQAIADAISTEEREMTLYRWRDWRRNERFKAYYRMLLNELIEYVENRNLSILSDLLDIIGNQVKKVKGIMEEVDGKMSYKELQIMSSIVNRLQKQQQMVLRNPSINIDQRIQTISAGELPPPPKDDPESNYSRPVDANKNDIIQQRIRELNAHLKEMQANAPPEPVEIIDHEEIEEGETEE